MSVFFYEPRIPSDIAGENYKIKDGGSSNDDILRVPGWVRDHCRGGLHVEGVVQVIRRGSEGLNCSQLDTRT